MPAIDNANASPLPLDVADPGLTPDLEISPEEWQAFTTTQANTLIIGDPVPVTRALTVAWLTLRRPVFWCDDDRFKLPPAPVATVVLWRTDRLMAGDQERLLAWMEHNRSTRVIARASSPLFPLVQQGSFSEPLYYRLNTMLLAIAPR